MSYVLAHFMSPLRIMRFKFVVAVTATTLAFVFVAIIVLGV